MKHLNKFLVLIFTLVISLSSQAQCAMCKASNEGNPEVGGGLNSGIEYIMVIPYILLGLFVVMVFSSKKLRNFGKDLLGKNKKKKEEFTAEEWY